MIMTFTVPIFDEENIGNEIDRVPVDLTKTDVQDLIEHVVRAVELNEFESLKTFSGLIGITEENNKQSFKDMTKEQLINILSDIYDDIQLEGCSDCGTIGQESINKLAIGLGYDSEWTA